MRANDVMVYPVITVGPEASVAETAEILLSNRISGVPVVENDEVIGIVSEGDLLRRAEIGTERRRSRWLELLTRSDTIAADYIKSHARKVRDIMTRTPVTVTEDARLAEIADLMEGRQIKRVPVTRRGKLVGIVTRANLLQAFATMRRETVPDAKADDRTIRMRVLQTIDEAHLPRPFGLNVTVKDGDVNLWGVVGTQEVKSALRVATEVTSGVVSVTDNLIVQPPVSSAI
jgi:CBS domain-containing protein